MTTKTQKTIVFAALIATMILPFGGMQSVYAIEEPDVAVHPQVDVNPDGTNQTDESDGSHPQVDVNPEETTDPDGTHLPVEPIESEVEVIPNAGNLPVEPIESEVEVIPDGTNQTDESDGSHPQVDVNPTGANGAEVEVIPDGTNQPEVPVDQTDAVA